MKNFLIYFCFLAINGVIASNSYCSMPCKDYRTGAMIQHIGCPGNPLLETYKCPRNARDVLFTNSTINLILRYHNKMRNYIAGGRYRLHRPACRMATMLWDYDLAYLAWVNVKQCRMNHDKCHNTKMFQYSGQNLALMRQTPPGPFKTNATIKKFIFGWFSEALNSTQAIIDSFPAVTDKEVGHFTVMMADRNVRVGCAAITYTRYHISHFLLSCNYATTNVIDHPIYSKCNRPGVHCKYGRNPEYPNLCHRDEYYAVNKWF